MKEDDVNDISIFILTEDGDCVNYIDFDIEQRSSVRFVVVSNDYLNTDYGDNNTIIISTKWHEHIKARRLSSYVFDMKDKDGDIFNRTTTKDFNPQIRDNFDNDFSFLIWQADYNSIPMMKGITQDKKARYDFDGYNHTINTLAFAENLLQEHNKDIKTDNCNRSLQFKFSELESIEQLFPVHCAIYSETETYLNTMIHGYLPAIGQLNIICKNADKLDLLIHQLNPKNKKDIKDKRFWSSTIYDDMNVWCWWYSIIAGIDKMHNFPYYFPLFRI